MYHNKLVVALKVNGKILREHGDIVYVPFGTEYTILLKNLSSKKVSITLEIDGTSVTENLALVLNANSETELKRFIRNGNLETGNAFKFIERTSGVEQHRGIKLDDGIIRIQFQYEKEYARVQLGNNHPSWYSPNYYNTNYPTKGTIFSVNTTSNSYYDNVPMAAPSERITRCASNTINDIGITVPGAITDQKFSIISSFPLETETHVMILRLLGETPQGKVVTQPVVVRRNKKCQTCGRVNKDAAKFCVECGTALDVL